MLTNYQREITENGEIHITANGGVDQYMPAVEPPYFIIYLPSNNNVYAITNICDVGERFSVEEVVQ